MPTGVSAIATNGEIDLHWNAAAGATAYMVKRGTVSGGPYSAIASGLTATLSWTMNATDTTGLKLELASPGKSFYQFGMISATRTNCVVSGLASQTT